MRGFVSVLLCMMLLAGPAAQAAAMSSQLERSETRTAPGTVFIGPDESLNGALSVWFTESATGDRFWVGTLDDMPPALQSFFRDAAATGQPVYVTGTYEWWGEGNVIRDITGYGMQ